MRELETDYLVIGGGAAGMAFTDTLVANSDAHAIEELEWMDLAIGTARRGWAPQMSLANVRGLDAMLASRKKR